MPAFASTPAPVHTLWDTPDMATQRLPGIWWVKTPSHGGFVLSDERQAAMPEALRLEVRDDGRGTSARLDGLGHGLIGVGERVKAYGGEMSAFAATTGGFVLRASLPVEGGDDA